MSQSMQTGTGTSGPSLSFPPGMSMPNQQGNRRATHFLTLDRSHPGGFLIIRDRHGWPRFQRLLEAWWILTGKWSLHRAWQKGHDRGAAMGYHRTVVMGGR